MMLPLLFVFLVLMPSWSFAEDLTNVQWLACHDGDTCDFNVLLPAIFGAGISVRLSGIDTPEIRGKCTQENMLATQARDFLIMQLQAAKTIVLRQVFRDKYFRIDAVIMADEVNLNNLMVSKGYAVPYTGSGVRHDWCVR